MFLYLKKNKFQNKCHATRAVEQTLKKIRKTIFL